MSPHQLASCASAAPTAPGSREPSGDMALNRCVKPRSPAAKAGCSSSKVALVWPAETMTPASLSSRMNAGVVRSGASVTMVTPPCGARQ